MWCHIESQAGNTSGTTTRRIQLALESATAMAPVAGISTTSAGAEKLAGPASVETAPDCDISRMHLLPVSATMMVPVAAVTETPIGPLSLAAAPAPSASPEVLLPASVVTSPDSDISRMRLLPVSATTMAPPPEGMKAIPLGLLNVADDPCPSAKRVEPAPPASVVTTPRDVTSRIALLPVSDTAMMSPPPGTAKYATPCGPLNIAAVPAPSSKPTSLPASVVTPVPTIQRMRWFPVSDTMTASPGPTATPDGDLKSAAVPRPSVKPEEPTTLPAKV